MDGWKSVEFDGITSFLLEDSDHTQGMVSVI
jgi:hypothetical protein